MDPGPRLDNSELFRAVQVFSFKDREEAIQERKKNKTLTEFIAALGLSLNEVNHFAQTGEIVSAKNALMLLEKSPHLRDEGNAGHSEGDRRSNGSFVPVACVGEEDWVARGDPVPVSMTCLLPGGVREGAGICDPNLNPNFKLVSGDLNMGAGTCLKGGPSKSWSDVVSNSAGKNKLALSFHPPSMVDGEILVKPPVEVLQKGNQVWSTSLVGYFLHSKLPYKVVEWC